MFWQQVLYMTLGLTALLFCLALIFSFISEYKDILNNKTKDDRDLEFFLKSMQIIKRNKLKTNVFLLKEGWRKDEIKDKEKFLKRVVDDGRGKAIFQKVGGRISKLGAFFVMLESFVLIFSKDLKLASSRALVKAFDNFIFFSKTFSLVFYVLLIIFITVFGGFWIGVFLSENAASIEARDISYGMGIVVVSCLSYLATEAGRHNKRHDVKEKKIISFKDASLNFLKELENMKSYSEKIKRGGSFLGFSYAVSNNGHSFNKKEILDFNNNLSKLSASWREVELSGLSLRKGGSANKEIRELSLHIDKIFANKVDSSSREVISVLSEINIDHYNKIISKEVYRHYNSINKDNFYTAKGIAILGVCIFLGGVYIGFLIERGGVWSEYKQIWLESIVGFFWPYR